MGKQKLLAREEKIKEKIERRAEEKKEVKKEKPKKKVEVKKPKTDHAKAKGTYLPISMKVATEICREIKGMKVDKAKRLLEDVINKKRAIRYLRYNKEVPHQRATGPGRYPVKVAKYVLSVLESAIENAKYFELSENDLFIKEARVERAVSKDRGKFSNVEITVKEMVKR